MNICTNPDQLKQTNIVLTVGTFDGVHLGHQKLITELLRQAEIHQSEAAIFTFEPHPRSILFPEQQLQLITTSSEKAELLKKTGLHHLIFYPFSIEFSQLRSEEFIEDILVKKIKLKKLIVGFNHHFGKDRQGDITILKQCANKFGFEIQHLDGLYLNNIGISSSDIRKSILNSEIENANRMLGYDFFITGQVIKGNQIGRTIGFPTANLLISNQNKILPQHGVYAVKIDVDGQIFNGMLNMGNKPTVQEKSKLSIEVHIFGFNGNLYEKTIRVFFQKKIREERKFYSLEELKQQLIQDKILIQNICS